MELLIGIEGQLSLETKKSAVALVSTFDLFPVILTSLGSRVKEADGLVNS